MTEYIFYRIQHIDESITDFYIGSTNNLFRRQSTCQVDIKTKTDKKHTFMRDNGGFKAFKWVTLEVGLYAYDIHAHMREQQLIDLHQPTLNTLRAYATLEQKKAQIIVKNKKHNNNPENKKKQKLCKIENRDRYNASRRARYAAEKALLLQPVLSVVDEPISPHEGSVH